MTPTKTPTSSLSVIEMPVKRVWRRTLARIQRIRSGVPPERPSPTGRLPFEVIEIIIAHLIYDKRSLRACTRTCRSWYIATSPHLHHTLIVNINSWNRQFRWPNPIWYMHALGLLPLVKTLCVRNRIWSGTKFSLTLFNCRVLSQFSALTNLRELHICDLDIPSFMPGIKRYFGHFSPTVQSLHLKEPRGSRRQVIYFIGLFQNLQDLHLVYDEFYSHEQSIDDLDLTLVPPFVPPLQGFLMVWNSTKVGLLEDMIDLFGGIRFRRMLLFNVVGMPLLLAASAKSLQTVVLYPSDPRTKFYLDPFDLSRSKSLHSLQIPASSIDRALKNGAAPRFLEHVLSTIRSPAFLQIIVIYWDSDFRYRSHSHKISPANRTKEASRHHKRFEVLREARKVREFQVVLRANVSGHTGKDRVRMLEEAIAEEKAKNGFGENFPEPLVSYVPWMYHTMVPVTL